VLLEGRGIRLAQLSAAILAQKGAHRVVGGLGGRECGKQKESGSQGRKDVLHTGAKFFNGCVRELYP
jgi:hypothetical protein